VKEMFHFVFLLILLLISLLTFDRYYSCIIIIQVPPVGGRIDSICRELETIADVKSTQGKGLIAELTKNFDDFPETPLPGMEGAGGGGVAAGVKGRTPSKGKGGEDHFIGFTFKRPVQASGGGAAGDAFAALDQIDMSRV
tara:strand:+ start:288 stop:707 length:420 start_codon:yes stop_codon:yes gene_type:complete